MRNILFAAAAVTMVSTAALAQTANNGAGFTTPDDGRTVTSAGAPGIPAREATAPVNRLNDTISSNGARTTVTGGIEKGVGTTLSLDGGNGTLGNGGAGGASGNTGN